jgi:hypothetical protein
VRHTAFAPEFPSIPDVLRSAGGVTALLAFLHQYRRASTTTSFDGRVLTEPMLSEQHPSHAPAKYLLLLHLWLRQLYVYHDVATRAAAAESYAPSRLRELASMLSRTHWLYDDDLERLASLVRVQIHIAGSRSPETVIDFSSKPNPHQLSVIHVHVMFVKCNSAQRRGAAARPVAEMRCWECSLGNHFICCVPPELLGVSCACQLLPTLWVISSLLKSRADGRPPSAWCPSGRTTDRGAGHLGLGTPRSSRRQCHRSDSGQA